MEPFIEDLIARGYLRTESVIKAFREIDRELFVPKYLAEKSGIDAPLPIGFGQTISQPLTVAFMLELLDVRESQCVLDVGSGSGWTTALLASIVGEKGKVVGIERISDLADFGRKNLNKFKFIERGTVEIHEGDGSKGFEKHAPYDRILVSASGGEVPASLRKQLKTGGKMVIPLGNSIWFLEKKGEGEFEEKEHPGFSFVPLVRNKR